MDCGPPGSSVHGDFPGKNAGVGCLDLLQGTFLTQGLNPRLLRLSYGFFTTSTTWEATPCRKKKVTVIYLHFVKDEFGEIKRLLTLHP